MECVRNVNVQTEDAQRQRQAQLAFVQRHGSGDSARVICRVPPRGESRQIEDVGEGQERVLRERSANLAGCDAILSATLVGGTARDSGGAPCTSAGRTFRSAGRASRPATSFPSIALGLGAGRERCIPMCSVAMADCDVVLSATRVGGTPWNACGASRRGVGRTLRSAGRALRRTDGARGRLWRSAGTGRDWRGRRRQGLTRRPWLS